jgi:hypothetical protein
LPRDFVEWIDFDKFIIENATITKWLNSMINRALFLLTLKKYKYFQV